MRGLDFLKDPGYNMNMMKDGEKTMSAATKAIFAIDSLEDLREAQNALNVRFKELQRRMAVSFNIGDKVSFKSRTGQTITGTVQKINQKTVKVKATAGNLWTVSASLLQKG